MGEPETTGATGAEAGGADIRAAYATYVRAPRAQPPAPFDKFTERARKVLVLAQSEAFRFNHAYIGTEHLLLGLVGEGDGIAAKALQSLTLDPNRVRGAVEYIVGRGEGTVSGDVGLTPRAGKALALAVNEARRLGHIYIGTEHLLLGLIREGEGIAAGVLESLGLTLDKVRAHIVQMLAGSGRTAESVGPKGNVVTCRIDDRDLDALDALVEAGIRSTRSDAASWLIRAGIDAHQPLFSRVYATVAQIRDLRTQAQAMVQGLGTDGQPAAPTPPAAE